MKKIKLLHIQLLPLLAGAQNVMLKILANLDREAYDIYVISCADGPLIEKLKEMKIEHIPVNSLERNLSFLDIKAFFEIFIICRKYRFDIVHTHSSKTGFIGRIAARLANVKKIIHTVHGYPFNEFQPIVLQWFYKACEAFAGLFCDFLVFVNDHDREMAINAKLISPRKAITIYNGVTIPRLPAKKSKSERFIIGSSFRFWEQKNPIQTVKAAIRVCRKNPIIDFIFLGDGELLNDCIDLVEKENLQNRIKFLGWQSNVHEYLVSFDVFLLYSKWEGLPISILEAMSVGLPIVASDISGNNELVSADNGILVKLNEVDKLVDILISLPSRKNELDTWGAESLRFVKEECSLQNFVSEYKKLYEL